MLWALKEGGDGLSLSKMAARSGGLVAVSTLHNVMTGKSKELTPDTIAGLAKILNTSEAHILAALNNRELSNAELESEEKERLWEMYRDIPRQCQQDVLDLLEVLQRNHSIKARHERRNTRRADVAAATSGANPRMTHTHKDNALIETEFGAVTRHPNVVTEPDAPVLLTTTQQLPDEASQTWKEPEQESKKPERKKRRA